MIHPPPMSKKMVAILTFLKLVSLQIYKREPQNKIVTMTIDVDTEIYSHAFRSLFTSRTCVI